jgi:hypothetical protein
MKFKLAPHTITGQEIVEVWDDAFIASLYPNGRALKVVSKYLIGCAVDESGRPPTVPAINVQFAKP